MLDLMEELNRNGVAVGIASRQSNLSDPAAAIRTALRTEQLTGFFDTNEGLTSLKELIQWLDDERAGNHIFAKREGLNTLKKWGLDKDGFFSHRDGKFFRIAGMEITSPYREVATWSQPILDNAGTGVVGLLVRQVNGRTYFLMQAKADVGNRNIVQLGPTVQFNPGNYIDNKKLKKPFLFDEFLETDKFMTVMKSMQSEEGGRFYKEESVHKVLMLPDNVDLLTPPPYRWLSYNQIRFFIHLGDIVNSSARSILACLV